MYLKRLEIKGFKSFAEKIDIELGRGITAIVGPNGSGKSNVSDAIRWVLGEQSAKTLRGGKMEDIIFAGTENRRALGCAEVSLTLDNSSSTLPLDYNEITVTRRLFRSGESEYLINNTQCRLKDVVELFMDTGIGRDGYSLIGQGKIDEILSARSEDRRNIFEEAAGIVKYKTRKNEAEKKLENTRQNLLRVRDIMQELEEQIEPLREQSKTARRFLELREELKELEINLILNNYDVVKKKLEKLSSDIQELNSSKQQHESGRTEIQREIQDFKINLGVLDSEYEKTSNNRFELEKQLENREGSQKLLKERQDNYLRDKERLLRDIAEKEAMIESINTDNQKILNDKKKIEEELIIKKNNIDAINRQYSGITESSKSNEDLIENKKSDLIQILKDISDTGNKINSIEVAMENLNRRKVQVERDMGMRAANIHTLSEMGSELGNHISEYKIKINAVNGRIKEVSSSVDHLQGVDSLLKQQRNHSFEKLKTMEARYNTLSDVERDMEGFNKSVKAIISNYKDSKKVFGVISDLIQVPKGYETAMEISLGQAVQNIVTDNEDTTRAMINFLKKNNLGRATFLPLTTIKSREARFESGVINAKGFLGIASNIVSYDKKFSNAVSNLLGRIIICDSLDNAQNIARMTDFNYRIVTLDGDVINSGGSFTGGSVSSKGSGIFSRKNELEQLKSMIDIEKGKLSEIENKLENNSQEINSLMTEINALREEFQKLTISTETEANKFDGIQSQIEALKEDLKDMEIELLQIIGEIKASTQAAADNRSEMKKLQTAQVVMEDEIQELQREFRVFQEQKEKVWDLLTNEKILMAETSKSLEAINHELNKFHNELNGYKFKIEEYKNEIEEKDVKIKETIENIKHNEREILNLLGGIGEIRKRIERIDETRKEVSTRIIDRENELAKLDESISGIIQSIHRCEISKSKLESEMEVSINKLWDDYELTILQSEKYKKPITSLSASSKRVQELKLSIKELGDVNVNSIEEYKRVVERYEFLKVQGEDLNRAEMSLIEIIDEITRKMESQFTEKFSIIRENFNLTFKELFGGGYADLKIEGDDILNSGIEIIVQPPGKKLQSLSLLSGGERGLSAIALVFAILKMKPTPFCVLDEIEASLDDANVNRFARFLDIYSRESQFIIITHRKGSMAVADDLYGVTMEEKGVSKIVSLKLKGGNNDGMAG